MKYKYIVFFLFLVFPQALQAQVSETPDNIVVEGSSAVIDNNRFNARNDAIDDAMENGLREVLNSFLTQEASDNNKDQLDKFIIRKNKYYVQWYKVLAEYLDVIDNSYRVFLEVVYFEDDLKKDLANRGILFKGRSLSKVVVIIEESRVGETFNYTDFWSNKSYSEKAVFDGLLKGGLEALDRDLIMGKVAQVSVTKALNGSLRDTLDIGMTNNAEVIILGKAALKTDVMRTLEGDGSAFKVSISIKAFKVDDGIVLAEVNAYDDYSTTGDFNKDAAIKKSVDIIMDGLMNDIRKGWAANSK